MADLSQTPQKPPFDIGALWKKLDKALLLAALVLLGVILFDPAGLVPALSFTAKNLLSTAPFVIFAVLAVAYVTASGAETLLSKAFEGRETRMIVLAAMVGGLSPFCSCEVIPFIAASLAMGVPLAAVMAFWLSSPLMDPAMFFVTAGALGTDFAIAKTIAAVSIGLLGGFGVKMLSGSALFADPLKATPAKSSCCSTARPLSGTPKWRFWQEEERVERFKKAAIENALFLGKWLLVAYVIEAVMIAYIPAELIAQVLGGDGIKPILIGAFVGAPAYLNGFAAVPLVEGLLAQGMAKGAAMSFVVAGGISCIPAAVAVWALVKPRVFAAYIGFALIGATLAGLAWAAV